MNLVNNDAIKYLTLKETENWYSFSKRRRDKQTNMNELTNKRN